MDHHLKEALILLPDEKLMIELVKAVERAQHKQGWDVEAALGYVYRRRQDDGAEFLAVVPFPRQPQDLTEDVPEGLMYLGGILRYSEGVPPIVPVRAQKDFAGLLFMAEGYEHDPENQAEKREVRFVEMIDCAGRYYTATRRRGEDDVRWIIRQPRDPELRTVGRVVVGLRDLMVAIGQQLPAGAMDVEAVAEIGVEEGLEA